MVTTAEFAQIALSFPNTESNPHFERTAFKVTAKRIFATLLEATASANIALTNEEQKEFCRVDKKHIYAVPNKWGEKGWTTFELSYLSKDIVQSALVIAYESILKKNNR